MKTGLDTNPADGTGSTLLPMLIGGLLMIVVGAIGVMMFV